MLNLPQPKLGDISAITITAPDLELSLAFYQKLGFNELMRSDFPFPWIQITDGALLIMLRKDQQPYLALTYYTNRADEMERELDAAGVPFISRPGSSDMIKRYVMQSPDGLKISMVTIVEGFQKPPGHSMLQMAQTDYFNPEKYVNKVCGMFGELAHPVRDLAVSEAFWAKLGFIVLSKMSSPYPWAILSDGLSVVGLHQTNHFTEPAITYFAADMKEKIEKLKAGGLMAFKETNNPSNIVITTPEGQHINLFRLGM